VAGAGHIIRYRQHLTGNTFSQGLAHGAAMGNLFASPSAQQIYNVARAAHNGAGVLRTTPPLTWRTLSALAATKPSISSAANADGWLNRRTA
jgi:dihydroxyacetone kinase